MSDFVDCENCGKETWKEDDIYTCGCETERCQPCHFKACLVITLDDIAYCPDCFPYDELPSLDSSQLSEYIEDNKKEYEILTSEQKKQLSDFITETNNYKKSMIESKDKKNVDELK